MTSRCVSCAVTYSLYQSTAALLGDFIQNDQSHAKLLNADMDCEHQFIDDLESNAFGIESGKIHEKEKLQQGIVSGIELEEGGLRGVLG